MIPVLYSPTESNFLSNGLGSLPDAIRCIVTEERNGQYELEMEYPVDGVHFSDITHSALLKVIPSDGASEQLFRIYKITKPMSGRVVISAEHVSYQLSQIPAYPFTASTCATALLGLKSHAAEACPFTFWTDKTTQANYSQVLPESIRSRLGGQQGSILDVYGGEYEWDNYTVKLHAHRGENRGVTLRYGKNIIDLRQEENIETTYTGVLPYWAGEGGEVIVLESGPVYSENADNYPYKRTKVVDFTSEFESQPTQAQLKAKAEAYIERNNIGIPNVNIKVSFIALWQTEEYKHIANLERVKLCDTVTIQFEKLGVSAQAKVIRTVYDVLRERYTEIEVGEARSSLAQRISEQEQILEDVPDIGMLQAAIENATEQITGAKGGHIRFTYDANNEPTELLIMDTADIETAAKIWRWNLGGLGYSSSGYAGPYGTAITQDGAIVANYITVGTLNANVIRAGLLTDVAGKNSWNMVTGEFHLSASTAVGDSTVATQAGIQVVAGQITSEVTRATGAEGALSSRITQNAEAITLKVSKGDISSEISQEAGQITISSDRFVLNSTYCQIAADGTLTASKATLTCPGSDKQIKIFNGGVYGYKADGSTIMGGMNVLNNGMVFHNQGSQSSYVGIARSQRDDGSDMSLVFVNDSNNTTTVSGYSTNIQASQNVRLEGSIATVEGSSSTALYAGTSTNYRGGIALSSSGATIYSKYLGTLNPYLEINTSAAHLYRADLTVDQAISAGTSLQVKSGTNEVTATPGQLQIKTGYTLTISPTTFSTQTNLQISTTATNRITIEAGSVFVGDNSNHKLGFFETSGGATRQSVSSVTGSTVDAVKTGLNNLITALKAYNLIG